MVVIVTPIDQSNLKKLHGHIAATITASPGTWNKPNSGWSDEVEAAFLDSVLSVQANYGNSPMTGVRRMIADYRQLRTSAGIGLVNLDDLRELAKWSSPAKAADLANQIHNQQKLKGKDRGYPLKTLAVAQAAEVFVRHGIVNAGQIDNDPEQKAMWRSVNGLGPVTWHYVLMLIGKPDVKADTMITRFVRNALGQAVDNEAIRQLVIEAAESYSCSATELDYAIWSWQRQQ
jgi:hypothetical protein